jgi:hypothetical protein
MVEEREAARGLKVKILAVLLPNRFGLIVARLTHSDSL